MSTKTWEVQGYMLGRTHLFGWCPDLKLELRVVVYTVHYKQ